MRKLDGWVKSGRSLRLLRTCAIFVIAVLLAQGTALADQFFVYQPIAARPAPKDFSSLGVPVSKGLNAALSDYQTKPSMTTAIGVLKFFPEFYKMTVDQRQKLFDADPDLS